MPELLARRIVLCDAAHAWFLLHSVFIVVYYLSPLGRASTTAMFLDYGNIFRPQYYVAATKFLFLSYFCRTIVPGGIHYNSSISEDLTE
ncbi:hypothetical protein Y032_0010g872 [Ancylostoma ceylanicum]|uniref:Uncharacterized protein n=1 Tax=Ancylostoma ceylanicum TaxID=53326 RepID=A0A016VGU5_9BILA|nr:hypothetical protein Y032_0010g872 [Ancylostoma ceylanicum]